MIRTAIAMIVVVALWALSLGYAQGVGYRVGYAEGMAGNTAVLVDKDKQCMAWWFSNPDLHKALDRACKSHKGVL